MSRILNEAEFKLSAHDKRESNTFTRKNQPSSLGFTLRYSCPAQAILPLVRIVLFLYDYEKVGDQFSVAVQFFAQGRYLS